MKDVFKKTFHLVKLLARENERVQLHLFERIDILLDVRIVESDLAIALKEVSGRYERTDALSLWHQQ